MKVYVVVEFATIEYEKCVDVMGVFSSEVKAMEAIAEYEEHTKDSCWHHEYSCQVYEMNQIWWDESVKEDDEEEEEE